MADKIAPTFMYNLDIFQQLNFFAGYFRSVPSAAEHGRKSTLPDRVAAGGGGGGGGDGVAGSEGGGSSPLPAPAAPRRAGRRVSLALVRLVAWRRANDLAGGEGAGHEAPTTREAPGSKKQLPH